MNYGAIMDLRVETYSGYRADERPVRFESKGRKLEVTRLLDRWYGPDYSSRGMHFTPDYPTSCGWPVRLPRRCWTISE